MGILDILRKKSNHRVFMAADIMWAYLMLTIYSISVYYGGGWWGHQLVFYGILIATIVKLIVLCWTMCANGPHWSYIIAAVCCLVEFAICLAVFIVLILNSGHTRTSWHTLIVGAVLQLAGTIMFALCARNESTD